MKKVLIATFALLLILSSLSTGFAGEKKAKSPGPAPNSGDCIPDGSGF